MAHSTRLLTSSIASCLRRQCSIYFYCLTSRVLCGGGQGGLLDIVLYESWSPRQPCEAYCLLVIYTVSFAFYWASNKERTRKKGL